MSGTLIESLKFAKGLDPVADAFDSTVHSDVIDMSDFTRIAFVVYSGVGATGTSTYTVEACDDVTPTTATAIPFYYRQILTNDVEGTLTAAAATGFVSTAGSSKIIAIEVREDALSALGFQFVRLTAVESVNSPVLAGILVIGDPKTKAASPRATSLT